MGKLLPIILLIVGIGAGAGAGMVLAPAKEAPCEGEDCPDVEVATEPEESDGEDEESDVQYVAMKNQFVVPVVRDDRVVSLIVLSISLEVTDGTSEVVFSREPKLRDSFLRVLFDHAHIGGFDGPFTESGRMSVLRVALLEVAQRDIGKDVRDILITDIVRQEM